MLEQLSLGVGRKCSPKYRYKSKGGLNELLLYRPIYLLTLNTIENENYNFLDLYFAKSSDFIIMISLRSKELKKENIH